MAFASGRTNYNFDDTLVPDFSKPAGPSYICCSRALALI